MPSPSHPDFFAHVDRVRHVLVVGKTGTGKSTLLRTLARHDLVTGRGLLVVDPHGDLAQELQTDVPRFRRNDLLVFDPTDAACPGLNPLRNVATGARSLVVANVLATLKKLFGPESWGPRTEHLLRHALLALAEVRGATLADAARMLVDERHRAWVVRQITDDVVARFWTVEFAGYGKQLAAEASAAPLNKLGALLASPVVRAVVTRSRPRLDADTALARSRVVLARVPKGEIGEDAALFLGGLVLGAFQHAAMGRAALAPDQRKLFSVIVDEATSFAPAPLLALLAEARKYGVGLVLATQSLAMLPDPVRAALLGNVGALVVFRVGGEDAEIVEREVAAKFGVESLTSLDIGEAVVRASGRPASLIRVPPIA